MQFVQAAVAAPAVFTLPAIWIWAEIFCCVHAFMRTRVCLARSIKNEVTFPAPLVLVLPVAKKEKARERSTVQHTDQVP